MLSFVNRERPDVAFFSESHWSKDENHVLLGAARWVLENHLGYHVTQGDDKDTTDRTDRTGFLGIVRADLGKGELIDAGTRQGFVANVRDPDSGVSLRVGGIHASDDTEPNRLSQVTRLSEGADVLMGDLNAMNRGARVSRVLRWLQPLTELVPETSQDFNGVSIRQPLRFAWMLGHSAQRLVRMASGKTLEAAQNLGLRDVDPSFQPTMTSFPVQLDHILADPGLAVANYTVHRDVTFSDHFPISAKLSVPA